MTDADQESYRLVSIEAVRAPDGCAGRDWYVYRISQGGNAITGYRQGRPAKVNEDVAAIVTALNGRRKWTKSKGDAAAERRTAAAKRHAAAVGSTKHSN